MTAPDRRRPFRIEVDVLATPEQIGRLTTLLGEALCAAPEDHPGACRIAWTTSHADSADSDADGAALTADDVAFIHEILDPVPVWPEADVNRSLGL